MTGIDEHIRTINRAIARLGNIKRYQDDAEAARTSLHHIAAREQKQRERIERLEVACGSLDTHEALTARVQELQAQLESNANEAQSVFDRQDAHLKELEADIERRQQYEIEALDRVQELEVLLKDCVGSTGYEQLSELTSRVQELVSQLNLVRALRAMDVARVEELEAEVNSTWDEGNRRLIAAEAQLKHSDEAYNRVEAENERLREQVKSYHSLWRKSEAENERLRRVIEHGVRNPNALTHYLNTGHELEGFNPDKREGY